MRTRASLPPAVLAGELSRARAPRGLPSLPRAHGWLLCRLPSEGGRTGQKAGLGPSFLESLLLSDMDLPRKLAWAQAWTRVPRRACRCELGGDCGLPTAAAVYTVLAPSSPQAGLEPSRSKQLPPQGGQRLGVFHPPLEHDPPHPSPMRLPNTRTAGRHPPGQMQSEPSRFFRDV